MLWIWRGAKPRTLSEDFKECAHFNMSVFEPLSGYPGHLGNLITFYKIFPKKREWWCQPNVRVCVCVCVSVHYMCVCVSVRVCRREGVRTYVGVYVCAPPVPKGLGQNLGCSKKGLVAFRARGSALVAFRARGRFTS